MQKRILPRQHEPLLKGAIMARTGSFAARVVAREGKEHFFDMRGRRIEINPKILARVPTTRREAAKRIIELRNEMKKPREVFGEKEATRAIEIMDYLRNPLIQLQKITNLYQAGKVLREVVESEKQQMDYRELRKMRTLLPEVEPALKVLEVYLRPPKNEAQAKQYLRGKPMGTETSQGVKDDVALYKRTHGNYVQIPLTFAAMKRLLNERMSALAVVEKAIRARIANGKEGVEKEKAALREEMEVLRKNAKSEVLSPVQIAQLYKFYEKQLVGQ